MDAIKRKHILNLFADKLIKAGNCIKEDLAENNPPDAFTDIELMQWIPGLQIDLLAGISALPKVLNINPSIYRKGLIMVTALRAFEDAMQEAVKKDKGNRNES